MSENEDRIRPAGGESPANASNPPSPTKAQDSINVSNFADETSPAIHSSSVPVPSSITLDSPQALRHPTNGDTVDQHGRHQPSPRTQVGDSKEPLDDFDWDDLEERFHQKMAECGKVEKELEGEFNEWLQVCLGYQVEMSSGLTGNGGRFSRLGVQLLVCMSLRGRTSGSQGSFAL